MLKKAGFVVAAAAATLLAVSPLAFAGEKGNGGGDGRHGHHGTASAVINDDDNVNSAKDNSSRVGLVNVTDNEVNVPVQVCQNNVLSDLTLVLGLVQAAAGQTVDDGDNTNRGDCTQENSSGGSLTQTIDD